MLTNCVNCAAVLHGNKCEYCGIKNVRKKMNGVMRDINNGISEENYIKER